MPGEVIDKPNPKPLPSHLPGSIDELMVRLKVTSLSKDVHDSLVKFRRAANYIAAGELASYQRNCKVGANGIQQ